MMKIVPPQKTKKQQNICNLFYGRAKGWVSSIDLKVLHFYKALGKGYASSTKELI